VFEKSARIYNTKIKTWGMKYVSYIQAICSESIQMLLRKKKALSLLKKRMSVAEGHFCEIGK
jgi:hypothetical protein